MSDNQTPSLIGSHITYAQGYAEETIGNLTGSTEWTEAGAKAKEAGLADMKAAAHQRDQEGTHGGGKAEELAGKAFGCEGMEKEGLASERK